MSETAVPSATATGAAAAPQSSPPSAAPSVENDSANQGTSSKNASTPIKMMIAGKELTFATEAERDAHIERLAQSEQNHRLGFEISAKIAKGIETEKEFKAYYKAIGQPDATVEAMWRQRVAARTTGGSPPRNRPANDGGLVDDDDNGDDEIDEDEERLLRSPRIQQVINSAVERAVAPLRGAAGVSVDTARETNETKLINALSTDPVLQGYWVNMTEGQKLEVIEKAKASSSVRPSLDGSRVLKNTDLTACMQEVRSFAQRMWGQPSSLVKAKPGNGGAPIIGPGGSAAGFADDSADDDGGKINIEAAYSGSDPNEFRKLLRKTRRDLAAKGL